MKATFKFNDGQIESVDVTLTITMPMKNWRTLIEQLDERWPSWEMKAAIRDMFSAADKHFESVHGEKR